MSDAKITGEVEKKVTVSSEDTDNVRNYSLHFGIAITPELEVSMQAFDASPLSYELMMEFKLEVCKWLNNCAHESFKDKLWDHPKKAAEDALYDLQFDKDLKEELGDGKSVLDVVSDIQNERNEE
jgi:hypothetical protein